MTIAVQFDRYHWVVGAAYYLDGPVHRFLVFPLPCVAVRFSWWSAAAVADAREREDQEPRQRSKPA